jgi:Tol biopolymer transport system component
VQEPERPTRRMSGQPWRRRLAIVGVALAAILAGGVFALVVSGRDEARPLAVEASPTPTATVQTPSPTAAPLASPSPSATPGPSATAAPTPDEIGCTQPEPSAPTAELVPGAIALIRVDGLRVRVGPGTACEAIDAFRAGEMVAIFAGPFVVQGTDWYEVRQGPGDRRGFVSGGAADGDPWLVAVRNGSIAFLSRTSFDSYSLDRMEPDGSGLATLHPRGNGRVAWSPDGRRIAFSIHEAGGWHIRVASADGGSEIQLGSGDDPAWAPDGSMIAFSRGDDDGESLMITRPDGTDMRRLSFGRWPAWSPDGSRVAVVRWGRATHHGEGIAPAPESLWSIEVATGVETRLTPDEVVDSSPPSWSPDSTMITFGNRLLDADGRILMSLEPGTSWAGPAPWSPDGDELAIIVENNSALELLRVDTGARRRVIAAPPGWGVIGHFTWSPDGRQLAYLMVEGDFVDWRIHVIDLQEGVPVLIGPPFGQFPVWQPVVSHGLD